MLQILLTSYAEGIEHPIGRCGTWMMMPIFLFFYNFAIALIANFIVFVVWMISALKKQEYNKIYIGLIPIYNIRSLVKMHNLPKWITVLYFFTTIPSLFFLLISLLLYGGYWLLYIFTRIQS